MKKTLLSIVLSLTVISAVFAQNITNEFFDKVNYIGAFDGVIDWTKTWTNFDPVNTAYPEATVTKGNGQFSRSAGLQITANETWTGVIKLNGWVYVNAGATLTIEPGTIIRGTEKSVLVIERGGKINAIGTEAKPIVFTSNQGVGFRAQSNWAGLVICGKGINNNAGGEGIAEGGIDSPYGGTDNADNSGELKYVRIEFPGYEVATGKEINGLTLYSVGSQTKINYVQVSYSGDDGFEWFGGAVNAKYLISYKTEDDDFDTDNGYCGMVQFGLVSRDNSIVDTDAANAFESDNDATGSAAEPFTKAIFSNISAFGPAISATEPATLAANHLGGSALRLRRNTKLQIYNSAFLGWGIGLRLESDGSQTAAQTDVLTVKNTIIAGIRSADKFKEDGTIFDATTLGAWFNTASRKNQLFVTSDEVKIAAPFNSAAFNFQPLAGSPARNASSWYNPTTETTSINHSFFDKVRYIGALDGVIDWTKTWTNFDPVNTAYPEATVTKGNGQFSRSAGLQITANETWTGVIKLNGWVYVNAGATLTIEPGTIIRGTEKSVLVIERGGKINAIGTEAKPIVFTSNQGVGFRAQSNWAGLVICGKGINNNAGGEGIAEGGIDSPYGGTDNADNSGELKYVRIEFPGYEVATGKEINGLTLYSVGSQTKINYVQVSYSGDDGFEWFGGAVNAKYLISYKTEDDDFDTDNGYCGMVQFGLVSRDNSIVDTDAANAFESDNDATGSAAEPFTKAIFSNISAFGPAISATEPATLAANHLGGSALRLRRNTKLQIYNSAFLGWGIGLRLESDGSQTAAQTDVLTVQNSIIAGIRSADKFKEDGTIFDAATLQTWYQAASRRNQLFTNNTDVKIAAPFNYSALNFAPVAGSPVFNASYWVPTAVNPMAVSTETKLVNYPNPFNGSTNIELQLESESYVRIFVMDMAGRTVAYLQEGNLTEGKHRFTFDGTALPKGLYFAKVVNGSNQKVVKMISK
ncbi:MAG: T9SS type A sorting domain-containing protein [Prolixibacteraceae bacterium]|nr:T9SS type A sorting domain-containing protein [Prolixibacteraceae bacterium]